MSMNCDIFLQWSVTPGELTALGGALWGWCKHTAGDTGIYRYLDNQLLADLIAGKVPASTGTLPHIERRGIHFRVRDEASDDRRATLASLRREIPIEGIADILVDGTSWKETDGLSLFAGDS